RLWGLEEGAISAKPGLDATSLFKALEDGSVKAVWIIATNPVASVANRRHVIAGLEKAELVIVQDAFYPTETCEFADVLLPGALWAEAEGAMVNSERRIGLINKIIEPPGDALPDWQWITRIAHAMGYAKSFPYNSAEDVFNEIRLTSNFKTEYILEGVTYDRLRQGSVQWPFYSLDPVVTLRRYVGNGNGKMRFARPNGKAKFWARSDADLGDAPDNNYPMVLTTGRLPHQWHTRTKTGQVEKLNRLNPSPFLQMNPIDAKSLGIKENDSVQVRSKNGTAAYPARIETRVSPGECFAPFHWNEGRHAVNQVVSDARDPVSLQPEFKFSAVRLSKIEDAKQEEKNSMNTQNKPAETSETFTDEQKEFLQGLMAGYQQQGLSIPGAGAGDAGNIQEPETVFGTPIDDLCKEEKIKHDLNGLDVWGRIVSTSEKNAFPEGGDVFRFKFHGLFYVSPAQEAYMLRCRIPAGILSSVQLRGLADIADQWGGGYASITTRANIQIREIMPKNAVNVLTKLYDVGLTAKGSGADNIRNITASPTSGIDPMEVYDVRPLAKSLHHYILNHRELYGLPRKFNIAFDNGGAVSVVMDTNDIGFLAVRVDEGHEAEPGAYFRVLLGGITGHGDFAQDSGVLVHPSDCLSVAAAIVQVFIENGDRTNRKKARMKYLLDQWGVEKYLEEVEKKLPFKLKRFPYENCHQRRHTTRHGHLGIFRQSQPGLSYVGVKVPVGQMTVKQMRQVADIADSCGSGEIRLTVWQNLIIPNVPEDRIPDLTRKLAQAGLDHKASSIAGGLVACTGNT
ncbi:NirA family protein, partial [bacterium]|nr:NirA family protein [bacterium]